MEKNTVLGIALKREIVHYAKTVCSRYTNVEVKFRGTGAYTNGTLIVLPAINDLAEIPMDVAKAFMGYAVHEIFHVMKTNFNALVKAINEGRMKADDLVKKFENAIEDYRIERDGIKDRPGTAAEITALRNQVHPNAEWIEGSEKWFADPRACGPLALTWTGSQLNGIRIPAMQKTLDAFPAPVKALLDRWTQQMASVKSTDDCIDLAVIFAKEAIAYAEISRMSPPAGTQQANPTSNDQPDTNESPQDSDCSDSASNSQADANTSQKSTDSSASNAGRSSHDPIDSENTDHVDAITDEEAPSADNTADNEAQSSASNTEGKADNAAREGNNQPTDDDTARHVNATTDDGLNNQQHGDEHSTESAADAAANHDNDSASHKPTPADNAADNSQQRHDASGLTGQQSGAAGTAADGNTNTAAAEQNPDDTSEVAPQEGPNRNVAAGTTDNAGQTTNSPNSDQTNTADGDTLRKYLTENADLEDMIDELADYISDITSNPLDEEMPNTLDGEVDPSDVIDKINAASAAAPAYSSPDPSDASDLATGKSPPGSHHYDDTRFVNIDAATDTLGEYERLIEGASGVISTTARTIRRLLMAEEKRGVLRNRRDGTFDIRNISNIVRQTGNCYKKTWERPAPETHLTILVDFSGSMLGYSDTAAADPLALAMMGALAVERATDRTQIETSIYGYQGISPHVTLYPFKEGKQATTLTRKRIGAYRTLQNGGTPTGEAMIAAAELLDQIKNKRRILLVLTDGQADNSQLCRQVIPVLERRGIEVVAIGISCESVREWAPTSHVIYDINALPAALLAIIDPRGHKKKGPLAA